MGRCAEPAKPSTLCRFERLSSQSEAAVLQGVLPEQFIKAHDHPLKQVVLDFDATDVPLHGMQEGHHWHGYYRNHRQL